MRGLTLDRSAGTGSRCLRPCHLVLATRFVLHILVALLASSLRARPLKWQRVQDIAPLRLLAALWRPAQRIDRRLLNLLLPTRKSRTAERCGVGAFAGAGAAELFPCAATRDGDILGTEHERVHWLVGEHRHRRHSAGCSAWRRSETGLWLDVRSRCGHCGLRTREIWNARHPLGLFLPLKAEHCIPLLFCLEGESFGLGARQSFSGSWPTAQEHVRGKWRLVDARLNFRRLWLKSDKAYRIARR
jgi:hypothetical protein